MYLKLKIMAELNNNPTSKKAGRSTKAFAPRIDFTPMVDLMFLLITFFMLTTTLAKPSAMSLAMPDDGGDTMPIADTRTMSICLGKNNKMEWYMGAPESPLTKPELVGAGKTQLRRVITEQARKVVEKAGNPQKGIIVLVKPSDKSVFRDVVDVLDELQITRVQAYTLADISQTEIERLKKDCIY